MLIDDRKNIAAIEERVNEPPEGGEQWACGNCIPTGAHPWEDHEDREVPDPRHPGETITVTVCRFCACDHYRPAAKDDYYVED